MALPAPHLDDRKFQDLVDEAKRSIALKCPEWTDHNVSDPGVTLVELFAWMTEIVLYRLNQVPERNYIKFLEMIGIELEAGDAARTGITFPLVAGWPGDTVLVPRGTEVATEATSEDEDPILFSTDRDLVLANPDVTFTVAESGYRTRTWNRSGEFSIWQEAGQRPEANDALYLGFDRDITGYLLELSIEAVEDVAVGLRPPDPRGRWEYFHAIRGEWLPLEIMGEDLTEGLNRSGKLLFQVPWDGFDSRPRRVDEKPAWWIRYRYTAADPEYQADAATRRDRYYLYDASPRITSLGARVLAGTVASSNASRAERELLGTSEGVPSQVFRLTNAPILALRPGETVEIEQDDGGWEVWERREDFAGSQPADKHFTLDPSSGEVRFGPLLRRPDGSTLQAGAIPMAGRRIRFSTYRYGGGSAGNVPAHTLKNLRRTLTYIVNDEENALLQITNREPATGGSDREELAHAKLRGQQRLRSLERAVTPEDYEFHAKQAKPNAISRAHCISPQFPGTERKNQRTPVPGVIRVLVVPALAGDASRVEFSKHLRLSDSLKSEVWRYLDERRLITTQVVVEEPQYLRVSTEVHIRVDPRHERGRVQRAVENALHRFLNPVMGGPHWQTDLHAQHALAREVDPFSRGPWAPRTDTDRSGSRARLEEPGWPFGYTLRLVDLRAVVQAVTGVRYLESIRVSYRRREGENRVQMRGEQVTLSPDMLVVSEQHTVNVSD